MQAREFMTTTVLTVTPETSISEAGKLLLDDDVTALPVVGPDGVLLGATSGALYGQAVETLRPGDLLLLHTDGLVPGRGPAAAVDRLLGLAPRFGAARTAQDCLRTVVEEFGGAGREDDACVLIARVTA